MKINLDYFPKSLQKTAKTDGTDQIDPARPGWNGRNGKSDTKPPFTDSSDVEMFPGYGAVNPAYVGTEFSYSNPPKMNGWVIRNGIGIFVARS